jgi:hypothetical protein
LAPPNCGWPVVPPAMHTGGTSLSRLPPGIALAMMLKLKTDVLRAFGRTNIDGYLPGVQKIIDQALAATRAGGVDKGLAGCYSMSV